MAEIINMPKLGFDMAEGTLVRWVKNEGQEIQKGEVLAEIETDKATVEVESGFSGIVARHLVAQGASIPVGTPIAVIAAPGEEVKDLPVAEGAPAPAAATAAETPPTTPAVETQPTSPADDMQAEARATLPSGPVKASPLARRLADEKGVDLHTIAGTGPGGRITKKDVETAKPVPAPTATAPAIVETKQIAAVVAAPRSEGVARATDEIIPLDRLRQAIGRRMAEAKQQVPHFYITHEYNAQPLLDLRKQVNGALAEEQKISVNDFIVKAVALALRRFPNLNASINGAQLVRHGAVNIGVAVAVEGGLLTVVCRDADRKPLRQLSQEIKDMAARARLGKVRPEDIEGSTFSISNLGMFDVENFAAIINPPEAAILAVGSARSVPVVVDGDLEVGLRMKATLSADHRVSDGAEAAQFMLALAEYIEKPITLLI
ncbi:MAG TPA: dihydrolipoamide acetyltransferase family protein [Anaerolineaceae bacterium]|nr:dihydrolipoamide acetyltransferase family protein [Anaerolineaceae bacterium]